MICSCSSSRRSMLLVFAYAKAIFESMSAEAAAIELSGVDGNFGTQQRRVSGEKYAPCPPESSWGASWLM